jgi:hypothetical protein
MLNRRRLSTGKSETLRNQIQGSVKALTHVVVVFFLSIPCFSFREHLWLLLDPDIRHCVGIVLQGVSVRVAIEDLVDVILRLE